MNDIETDLCLQLFEQAPDTERILNPMRPGGIPERRLCSSVDLHEVRVWMQGFSQTHNRSGDVELMPPPSQMIDELIGD